MRSVLQNVTKSTLQAQNVTFLTQLTYRTDVSSFFLGSCPPPVPV